MSALSEPSYSSQRFGSEPRILTPNQRQLRTSHITQVFHNDARRRNLQSFYNSTLSVSLDPLSFPLLGFFFTFRISKSSRISRKRTRGGMMESLRTGSHSFDFASRKAEEAATRRYEAVEFLSSMVGSLGISTRPSEKEFISCLRNGLILCNAINKIHPGAVPKVVKNYSHQQSSSGEYHHHHPPPAYQYFENVRNFLVALEGLKLPAFEASDLEKDDLESGSVAKVVDCILGLKGYHNCGKGSYKQTKPPLIPQWSASKSSVCDRKEFINDESNDLEDIIAKLLVDHIVESKDENLTHLANGSENSRKTVKKIISNLLNEKLEPKFQEVSPSFGLGPDEQLRSVFKDGLESMAMEESPVHRLCLLKTQEKKLSHLKAMYACTKADVKSFQLHLQRDLKQLENQVQEMSSAALGYQKVVEENRKLYNIVQDLKGNIRVYCRIRPILNDEQKGIVDFDSQDGSLTLTDPSKPMKDATRMFRFNHVFGPLATQEDVFKETKPLIKSVMDGYNVCILAYGQTGSGKTYTMSGPRGGRSDTEKGISYMALNDLFLISDERKKTMKYEIHVQMVEICNEQVRDLLAETPSSTELEIRNCFSDAAMHSVESAMDVLRLMEAGEVNRVVSGRSHSVLTVHVRGKETKGKCSRSVLHMVDLAGSERVDVSEMISVLEQKNSQIPHRNSKLNLLLQDSLGGKAKAVMFVHLRPEQDSFNETVSSLKFAQRVSTVELGASSSLKDCREVIQLKAHIESLKKALAGKEGREALCIKSPMTAMERTPQRLRRLSIENRSNIKTPSALRCGKRLNLEEGTPNRVRTSLRTNGKLVNSCDKRRENNVVEERSPLKVVNNGKSSSDARMLRRRSLTGVVMSERSRRSSLENCANDGREGIMMRHYHHPSSMSSKR